MEKHSEVFVAFDVAKKKHAIAIAEGGRTGEVRFLGDVENSPLLIERTIKGLADRYDRLHVCFEAGPTGYGLYRQIQDLATGKRFPIVVAAIAREMAAFLWPSDGRSRRFKGGEPLFSAAQSRERST